jgi:hypothetical protein
VICLLYQPLLTTELLEYPISSKVTTGAISTHPPCLSNTTYIESKEYKPYQFTTPRDSYKHRKRSRSSRNYSKYSKYTSKQSPKYIGNPSGSKIEISSGSKDRRRDRKYSDKRREDEFKIPSMYSIASSENKKRKDK